MRLLLDESVPAKLRRYLPDHDVRSAVDMGGPASRTASFSLWPANTSTF